MKKLILATCALMLSVCWARTSEGQTGQPLAEPAKIKVVAVDTNALESFPYDAGKAKFIVTSEDTSGAWSLVELTEMPGYHTNLHRHSYTSEAFYVLEGVLTVKINDKVAEFSAGSYVLIPPGTPHEQGNRGKVPVRLLLTMTPGGFERSFKDRAELFKTVKPSDPDFRKKRQENAKKGSYDVEFLADWDLHE
jgi:quercetin dioxygenase-like cupin family protein